MTNPLLEARLLPPFSRIRAQDVVPAIEAIIAEGESGLQGQLDALDVSSWSSLVEPIEKREDKLSQAWAPVSHLNAVVNNDELRAAYEQADQLITAYTTRFGQNVRLYEAYLALSESADFTSLSQPKKQAIRNAIRDFKLSGVALTGDAKEQYKNNRAELSSLTTYFSNNVLDATNGWFYHVEDEEALGGLPEFLKAGAKKAAQERELEGYVLTLDLPVYSTVMSQSANQEVRKIMYEAYCTRASRVGPAGGKWDNSEIIDSIMELRQRQAEILGYNNYAEVSLASKMAPSPQNVIAFLQDLADKTRSFAETELAELSAFAKREFDADCLNAWDIAYFSEQLKLKKYQVSQELLRPYFPLDLVLNGLFRVVKSLYGIDVKVSQAETWHTDARYYELFQNEEKIAGFYLDLYARSQKRGGAWMADCRTRRMNDGELQLPVAFLVCNFNAPFDDKPALLTHQEVVTLFHEFGHGLHHMLTKMDVAAVSGINGVEWDAVELPSQFMENFCWQPEVLAFLSCHYETGEPLPEQLLSNMLQAKNFQSAMQMLRQLEFAIFDLRLHLEYGSETFRGVQALLNDVREKVAVVIPPEFNRFQNGFTHIFAGGYAAGYYSYKWAEVLSADAFSVFEEEGIFNADIGARFLHEILEKGGSEPALDLFRKFRGREPSPEPLMKHSGLLV